MKASLRWAFLAGSLALGIAGSIWAETEALHPKDLSFPELTFEPIRPKRVVLPSGMTVILLEDHELPTLVVSGLIRGGDSQESADRLGMTEMLTESMRSGGAGRFGSKELDEALDFVAAQIELGSDRESLSFSGQALSKDQDLFFEALAAILLEPRFEKDKVELARAGILEGIRRQNDQPGPLARREHYKLLFGKDNPWARTAVPKTVEAVTRAELLAFHKKVVHPKNIYLGVAGDFDPEALEAKLTKLFPKSTASFRPESPEPVDPKFQPGTYLIRKEGNQTTVRMGHMGLPRLHPDFYAAQVMNRILGIGTFTSRMGIEIRSNRGLAYSVGSGIFESNSGGVFLAVAQTKAESTFETTRLMREIIAGMQADDITDEELSNAKSTLLNQWVFEFDSPTKIVSTKVSHEFYGYPADYLEEYPKKIREVTKADVVRVARSHLRPDRMVVLWVGNPEAFGGEIPEGVTEVPLERFD